MVFAVAQMPLVKRFHLEPVSLQASDAAEGHIGKDAN
jgi:intracellular septation protein